VVFFNLNILKGSLKRNNLAERFDYILAEDEGSLIALPEGYPKKIFHDSSFTVLDNIFKNNENTRDVSLSLEEGYAKIKYHNYATRLYLLRTDRHSFVNDINNITGYQIKFVPSEFFGKKIILSCKVNQHIEDHKFLPFINGQNGIITSRCSFEECEPVVPDGGFTVYFGVTPYCMQQIADKDFKLKIRRKEVDVVVLFNPFPQLFRLLQRE
jgi:hypothetical protein